MYQELVARAAVLIREDYGEDLPRPRPKKRWRRFVKEHAMSCTRTCRTAA